MADALALYTVADLRGMSEDQLAGGYKALLLARDGLPEDYRRNPSAPGGSAQQEEMHSYDVLIWRYAAEIERRRRAKAAKTPGKSPRGRG